MKKILIIEDTKSILEEITTILSFEDYNVIQAENGSIGFELALKKLPDLIISDIMMPEIDGYTLKEELSKNSLTENIPFIFLTARTAKEELRKGMNLGADDYITKPFTAEDVIQSVKNNLRKYERLKNINQEKINLLTSELEREKELSMIDPLTGAANRRGFIQKAKVEISRAMRNKYPVTIAYIDLDNFKSVNDNSGHCTGDDVLKKISECAVKNIRLTDVFARLGGDEFIIMLPEANNVSSINIIKRINESFLKAMSENNLPVTLSIGLLTFNKLNLSIDEMISLTDEYMYKSKHKGKNTISADVAN